MMLFRRIFVFSVMAALMPAGGPAIAVAGVSVQVLARLGGSPEGFSPQAALIAGNDGDFYGTTPVGGPSNYGTVYKVSAAGVLTTLHAFTGGKDGAAPLAALVLGPGGDFYGTTSTGGAGGAGVIFKITPAGGFKVLHHFGALDDVQRNVEGASPQGALIVANGNLYGTAHSGGSSGSGTIFRVTPAGAVKVLYALGSDGKRTTDGLADGGFPKAALVSGGDGKFYGTTSASGKGYGTIFRVSAAGAFEVLYSFTGGPDGSFPSNLTGAGDVFYGTTETTFFSVNKTGQLTTLHTFSRSVDGFLPSGLTAGPGGVFYGTASEGGPDDGYGTIFEVTNAGAVTVLYTFQEGPDGAAPAGAPVLAGSALYGVANFGGITTASGNTAGGGTIYQFPLGGSFKTLHVFSAGGSASAAGLLLASNGFFYGSLSDGGALGGGTIFAATPTGAVQTVYDFNPDTEGAQSRATLVEDRDGTVYGTAAAEGEDGGGAVFSFLLGPEPGTGAEPLARAAEKAPLPKLDKAYIHRFRVVFKALSELGLTPKQIYDILAIKFTNGDVDAIDSATLLAGAAKGRTVLYGIDQTAGANGDGSIYSLTPDGTQKILHAFGASSQDGYLPEGVTGTKDGSLFGTTYGGGTKGFGTIFTITAGGAYRILHSFAGTGDGIYPLTGLTLGKDGNFYGTTSNATASTGGSQTSGSGTIFSITPGGDFRVLHTFAKDGSEGSGGTGELVQAPDGVFYGVTPGGGTAYGGTVFSISSEGKFTSLYSFGVDATLGSMPIAALTVGSDTSLYGTTSEGDVLFKVLLDAEVEASLTANIPEITAGTGERGEITLTLSAAPTKALTVDYKVTGTGANGTDYELLSGQVAFQAGTTTAGIQVVPVGNLGGAGMKTVILTLLSGNGYTVAAGDASTATVTILGK